VGLVGINEGVTISAGLGRGKHGLGGLVGLGKVRLAINALFVKMGVVWG